MWHWDYCQFEIWSVVNIFCLQRHTVVRKLFGGVATWGQRFPGGARVWTHDPSISSIIKRIMLHTNYLFYYLISILFSSMFLQFIIKLALEFQKSIHKKDKTLVPIPVRKILSWHSLDSNLNLSVGHILISS